MNEISALDAATPAPLGPDDESVTHAVVEAVADAKGVSPVDLTPPLYSAVDTDALERFVDSLAEKPAAVQISFDYAGIHVTVAGDGSVSLDESAGK